MKTTNQVDVDKKQSAKDFSTIIMPLIEKHFDAKVISLENLSGKLPLMLDRHFSTDAIYIKDGKMSGVSSRIQRGKNWATFSMRSKRDSQTKTELQKHLDAIANGTYLPEITIQAYIVDDNVTIGVALTADILDYITKYNPLSKHTRNGKVGQAEFLTVAWDDMKNKGYRVFIIKDYIKKNPPLRTDLK